MILQLQLLLTPCFDFDALECAHWGFQFILKT